MMHAIVMFSSGAGSWAAGRRHVDQHPDHDITLLFADTNVEDGDNYRFLLEAAANVIGPLLPPEVEQTVAGPVLQFRSSSHPDTRRLTWITNNGETIWDVFKRRRFLANSRIDTCSEVLKRIPMRRWLEDLHDPDDTVVVIGFGWDEPHRLKKARPHWVPWTISAPMTDEPYMTKDQVLADLRDNHGIEPPRLYTVADGELPHANCGGLCVKAGHRQFKLALDHFPDVFDEWMAKEQEVAEHLGKNVAILRDRRGGKSRPLPLAEFKQRFAELDRKAGQEGSGYDPDDVGTCSCLTPAEGVEGEDEEDDLGVGAGATA